MARITKKPDERKSEILEISKQLFNSKGYDDTSINDIVENVGIAKGTLYYYFKTKEDILDAIVEGYCQDIITMSNEIADDPSIDAIGKIKLILAKQREMSRTNGHVLENLHRWNNIQMHQRIFVYIIENHSPVLAKVVEQGIHEGVFCTEYPLEAVRFILAGYRMLFDPGHFSWSENELARMSAACQEIVECALGAEKGAFAFLTNY